MLSPRDMERVTAQTGEVIQGLKPFHSDDGMDEAKGRVAAALIIEIGFGKLGEAVSDVGPAIDRLAVP